MPAWTRPSLLALAAALVVSTAACGGDDALVVPPGAPGTSSGSPTASAPTTSAPTTSAPTSSAPATTPAPSPSEPSAPAAAVAAQLTITVDDGAGAVTTHTLTCQPAGGDHPDPDGACAALAAGWPAAFQPVPKDRVCTMQYGGPQAASVTGTVAGQPVVAAFNRTNGCEIGRWTAVEALLGPAGDGST